VRGEKMTDVRTIATGDLRDRLDQTTKFECWNVLTDEWFTGEMIPGSRRMPLDTIEQNVADVPKDAEIVTYCGGPKCPQSIEAAKKLSDLGYTNVRAFEEGLEGWKAAGHSIEKPEPLPAA
jgi:rhodanese-related sulfurtransferase